MKPVWKQIWEQISQNHTEWLRLEGAYGNQLEQIAQGHSQSDATYLQRWRLHNLSGQPAPVFDHTNSNVFFVYLNRIALSFSLCPLSLFLSLDTTENSLVSPSLLFPIRYSNTFLRLPLSLFFGRLNSPNFLHFSSMILQSLHHFHGLSLDSFW